MRSEVQTNYPGPNKLPRSEQNLSRNFNQTLFFQSKRKVIYKKKNVNVEKKMQLYGRGVSFFMLNCKRESQSLIFSRRQEGFEL